jgi:hypothetical protein
VDGSLTKPMFKAEPNGDISETAVGILQNVASCQSKALYVSFQIAINGTCKQYHYHSNGKALGKMTKKAAFKNADMGKKSPPCRI